MLGDDALEPYAMTLSRPATLRHLVRWLGPALVVVVVWRIGPRELWRVASAAEMDLLGLSLLLGSATLGLRVVRWRALLRQQGHHYPLGRSHLAVLASLYLGMVTPGRVGDLLRVQYVRHEIGVPYSQGLAVTVVDRLCDVYVLVAFAAIGISHFTSVLQGGLAQVIWITVALAALSPLVLFPPRFARRVTTRIYERFGRRLGREGFENFFSALRKLLGIKVGYALLLTVTSYLVGCVQAWLISRAIDVPLGFVDVIGLISITSLLGLLPISISGLGVRELFLILAFPAIGYPAEKGVAFGLLVFAILYVTYVVAGFIAWQLAPPPFSPLHKDQQSPLS